MNSSVLKLPVTAKKCRKCEHTKPASEFYVKKAWGGASERLSANCKPCDNARSSERYRGLTKTFVPKITLSEKTCSTCKETKSASEFYSSVQNRTGLKARCRTCCVGGTKKHMRENPDKYQDKRLRMKYGITLNEAKAMLASQMGICANRGCGKRLSFDIRNPNHDAKAKVDHCHKSEKVRGVLCNDCNLALGWVESRGRILGLMEYLDKHS